MRVPLSDYRALAEVRYEIRRFVNFSEAASREAGIEPQQHQMLLALKGLPDGERPTIRALAERLLIQHHSAVELATRSEERGLIRRAPGDQDRREVILHVTPLGERLLDKLSRLHRDELREAAPLLIRALRAATRSRRREG